MAEPGPPPTPEVTVPPAAPGRSKDEVALELMKFIAVTTGYGKATSIGAGFSAKPGANTPEAQVDSLLDLFQRCRKAVAEEK